jgi:hypothetical protein
MDQVFYYSTNWKEGKVNQMWIQQITPEYQECDHKYVAIAYNPEKNVSMVMSKTPHILPRYSHLGSQLLRFILYPKLIQNQPTLNDLQRTTQSVTATQ